MEYRDVHGFRARTDGTCRKCGGTLPCERHGARSRGHGRAVRTRPRDARRNARNVTGWLIASVDTGREFEAAESLRRYGLKVICPGIKQKVRPSRARKPIEVIRAAWEGYVAISRDTVLDLEFVVMQCPGVHYIVAFGEEYSEERDEALQKAVDYIRELEGKGVFVASTEEALARQMLLGAWVKVAGGPCGGRYGQVAEVKGERAKVEGGDFPKPAWLPADRLLLQNMYR